MPALQSHIGHCFRILCAIMFLPFRAFLFQPIILFPTCLLACFFVVLAVTPIAFNHILTCVSTPLIQFVALAAPSFAPVTYLYCTVYPSSSFCPKAIDRPAAALSVSKVTKPVVKRAKLASDVFESVAELGNPSSLDLRQADIRELALAVECSTALDVRKAIASQLRKLSDKIKDVKDQVIVVNSQGINTFVVAAHQVGSLYLVNLPGPGLLTSPY